MQVHTVESRFMKARFKKDGCYTANPFPVMTTGISLCTNSTLKQFCKDYRVLKQPFKPCSMNLQELEQQYQC